MCKCVYVCVNDIFNLERYKLLFDCYATARLLTNSVSILNSVEAHTLNSKEMSCKLRCCQTEKCCWKFDKMSCLVPLCPPFNPQQ